MDDDNEAPKDTFDDDLFHPDQVPRLAEDGPPPAAPATDVFSQHHIPADHPITDTDVDQHEMYDEGLGALDGVSND